MIVSGLDATSEGETAEDEASRPTMVSQEPIEEHLSPPSAAAIGEAASMETAAGETILEAISAPERPIPQDTTEERPSSAPPTEVGEASGTRVTHFVSLPFHFADEKAISFFRRKIFY